jgi:hypothetical protein
VAWIDHHAGNLVDHRGFAVTLVLSVLLAAVAVGTYLPRPIANGSIVLAVAVSAMLWVVGENFGALFTNGATDVNSGPLLILLAVAFWRRSPAPSFNPTPAVTDGSAQSVEGA